jgi:hypothetical protein
MSRTIITKSDSEFFTNVNSEQLLGVLCQMCNAKFFVSPIFNDDVWMAYSMTEEEATFTSDALKTLIPRAEELFESVKYYFGKGSTHIDLIGTIRYYSERFKESKGYECV